MKTRICTVLLTLPLLLGCYGCSARASYLIAEAQYPEMAPYPNEQAYTDPITGEWDDEGFSAAYNAWRESRKAQRSQPEGYTEGVEAFTHLAAKAFLAEEQGKNGVISPLNLYLALGMLAEVTDGASREQILSVLQADSIETLRSRAESLWNANYNRDGALTSVLAASLWLDEDLSYHTAPLDALTKVYRASAYRGQMGDPAYDEALRAWLKAQTGGLLDSQIDGLSMSPENILTLASTVYYQAKWKNEYSEANTKKGIFYSPAGEVVCDFMHRSGTDAYYWSTHYGAISR